MFEYNMKRYIVCLLNTQCYAIINFIINPVIRTSGWLTCVYFMFSNEKHYVRGFLVTLCLTSVELAKLNQCSSDVVDSTFVQGARKNLYVGDYSTENTNIFLKVFPAKYYLLVISICLEFGIRDGVSLCPTVDCRKAKSSQVVRQSKTIVALTERWRRMHTKMPDIVTEDHGASSECSWFRHSEELIPFGIFQIWQGENIPNINTDIGESLGCSRSHTPKSD